MTAVLTNNVKPPRTDLRFISHRFFQNHPPHHHDFKPFGAPYELFITLNQTEKPRPDQRQPVNMPKNKGKVSQDPPPHRTACSLMPPKIPRHQQQIRRRARSSLHRLWDTLLTQRSLGR